MAQFVEQYHISIVPVTVDGVTSPAFPHSQLDKGQARALKVTHFPSLFWVDPQTQQLAPLAYGFLSLDQLEERVLAVENQFREA